MLLVLKSLFVFTLLSAIAAALGASFDGFERDALCIAGGVAIGALPGVFFTRLAVLPICLSAAFLFGTRIPLYHALDQIFPLFLLALVILNSVMYWCKSSEAAAPGNWRATC